MATQISYPGVYTREFAPGPPIQAVGTSVAAFIGPAATGDINVPTKIASFDEFKQQFGDQPLKGLFLWYAVRGFFENGGKVCYIVRASDGIRGEWILNDAAGNGAIVMRALQPGQLNPTVTIAQAHLLQKAQAHLYRPTPSASYTKIGGRDLTLTQGDGAKFRPGDLVLVGNSTQVVMILRVTGDQIRLADDLSPMPQAAGPLKLADIPQGATTMRVQTSAVLPKGVLVPGTVLTISQQGINTETGVVASVQTEGGNPPTYRVTLRQGIKNTFSLDTNAAQADVESEEFKFDVSANGPVHSYDNLSIDPAHPRYFAEVINTTDGLIRMHPVEPPSSSVPPQSLPAQINAALGQAGQPEDLTALVDSNFTDALETLQQVIDVNLISIPDRRTTVVQQAMIAHCEALADRFAVLDSLPNLQLFGASGVEGLQRPILDSTRGYAALYYPWVRVPPLGTGAPILVPPSGHVCGIMARSDELRGVHKAPANEIVNGALDVERTMSEVEHGVLNLEGINVIRRFHTGSRPMLFGARTTATDTNWQYVNIRRLFLFLEKSIQNGIRWAVFEPNNTALWEKLKRTITDFLTRVWRDGGLFGETADKAFYVRIDEALNPDSERALGRLHIEIGVRPSYPAEFIIVRIGIWYGGSQVTEG